MFGSLDRSGAVFGSVRGVILAVLIAVGIAACGGGGGGGDSPGTSLGGTSSKVFVADSANRSIASVVDANPSAGTMLIDRIITGSSTGISNNVGALAIDAANDRLYVANGTSILVFNNAGTARGNAAPVRTLSSAQFGNVSSLFLDTANNVLYVGDDLNGVWVINNASSANGSITPDRSITGNFTAGFGGTFQIHGIFVDTTRDMLYVSLSRIAGTNGVLVFNGASTANGSNLVPARSIISDPSVTPGGIFVDVGGDRLYLADTSGFTVHVIDGASAVDGAVAPSRTINIGSSPASIAIDPVNDRLYALNPDVVYIVNGASTADGSVSMTAVFAPSGSILTAIAVRP